MKLQKLHEQFIDKASRPMSLGSLPIKPKLSDTPVLAVSRWHEVGGALHKEYRFRSLENRNQFVLQLLVYETTTLHSAHLRVDGDCVNITVQTKDICSVSELDREYARYADLIFKDIVYSP